MLQLPTEVKTEFEAGNWVVMRSAHCFNQADMQHPFLPTPETMGRKKEGTSLIPQMMSLPPIPEACEEFVTCTCTTRCKTTQ